ncbi:MAG: hypothetical protein K6A92_06390 [Lachnospiraceae bacterium]|nr:hypothetical protein [Lachnospiraceae bacterium]
MKDRELKAALKNYAGSPDPVKKDTFLRRMKRRENPDAISVFQILQLQLRYIRKRVWLCSVIVFALAVLNLGKLEEDKLMLLGDLMPILAGIAVIEGERARFHGMQELERVTVLSAKACMTARMTIFGVLQMILSFAAAAVLAFQKAGGSDILTMAAMLWIPYLVTSISCLILSRTRVGRDYEWSMLVVAVLVVVLRENLYHYVVMPALFGSFLIPAALLLGIWYGYELNRTICREACA